jgi:hypothetical protein
MRKVASSDGFKDYNEIELAGHAKGGCMLCILLFEKWRPQYITEGRNPRYLHLRALSKDGTAIRGAT